MERSTALNRNFNSASRNHLVERVCRVATVKGLFCAIAVLFLSFLALPPPETPARTGTEHERILEAIGRIEKKYHELQSYECDIEGLYFDSGKESERYVFRFYFRQPNLFRIEFREPYPGMTIFYTQGDKEFVARPFRAFPSLQFRFSVSNPLFKTPSGQGVNQMHLLYFLEFLRQNAGTVPQEDPDLKNDGESFSFWVTSKDYATGGATVRYRMHIDTRIWLPDRIERYDTTGTPMEFTFFRNFHINPDLNEAFFDSGYQGPSSTFPAEPVRP
jgi:outer membrane lipoprotein-sorting protein